MKFGPQGVGPRAAPDLARTHALGHIGTGHTRYMRTTHQKEYDTVRQKNRQTDHQLESVVPHLRGAELEDAEWRRAHPGRKLRSAYLTIVGENPDLTPGDHRSADSMLRRVKEALLRGGWTRNEWARLKKMEVKWTARAKGVDWRFELVGNRRGGLPAHAQQLLRLKQAMGKIRRTLDAEKSEW